MGKCSDEKKGLSRSGQNDEGVSVRISDSVFARLREASTGRVVSQATSDSAGRQSSVDFSEAGDAQVMARGRPRQGESGSKEAVMRLAAHLHDRGELPAAFVVVSEEEDPRGIPPDGPVDAEVRSTDAGSKGQVLLRAQVVRAALGEILQVLGEAGSYDNGTTVTQLADSLHGSVDKKAKRYPPVELSKIHLVLEALDHQAPVSAQPVVDQFRLHHAGHVKSKGFIAIWLVGPTEIHRLDG